MLLGANYKLKQIAWGQVDSKKLNSSQCRTARSLLLDEGLNMYCRNQTIILPHIIERIYVKYFNAIFTCNVERKAGVGGEHQISLSCLDSDPSFKIPSIQIEEVIPTPFFSLFCSAQPVTAVCAWLSYKGPSDPMWDLFNCWVPCDKLVSRASFLENALYNYCCFLGTNPAFPKHSKWTLISQNHCLQRLRYSLHASKYNLRELLWA